MKLLVPTALTLSLVPRVAEAWTLGPRYYGMDLWTPSRTMLQKQQELMQRQQDLFKNTFSHTSPRYEITDTEEKFQVAVDVPGVKMEDIHVNLEQDGSVLSIRGSRKASDENSSFTSKFSQSFSIDPTIDVEKFSANLQNGVLVISAPKDMKRIEDNIRKIPITQMEDDVVTTEMKIAEEPMEADVKVTNEESVENGMKEPDGVDVVQEA